VLGRIRERLAIPVIALSTRATEGDKVAALDAGADDYVHRPFGAKELLARIRVAMRFTRSRPPRDEIYEAGPIRVDTARYQVTVEGRSIHLTPIEFRLLALLARFGGATVTRDQLLHEIWGSNADQVHTVRVHIAALRRKIEADHAHPRWLITVLNVGYRLRDGPS
jgi:two-component system KDP operon response regulator KdpE